MASLFTRFAETVSSTWRLLSDTTNFLSRVNLLDEYEQDIRRMRERLTRGVHDPQAVRDVRGQVTALRRSLREQGHDLRLGSKDIAIEGWRHDDAMGEGFRRVVLGIADDDIYAIAGESNHIDLAEALEERCRARRNCKPYRLHCLWYRWRNDVLVLSGAASETSQQFQELKEYFSANKEFLLRKLSLL
jgi:hypothetical protein